MPKVVANYNKHLPQTCGVGELGYFRYDTDYDGEYGFPLETVSASGGCGWIICSFTPKKKVYEDAYKAMVKRYGEPLFKSPVRTNTRTQNKFFFCIFDGKGK